MSIFVSCTKNSLGVGKLVRRVGEIGTVEYFVSPANDAPEGVELPMGFLRKITLPNQTRVYFRNPDTYAWEVGRILDFHDGDRAYLVKFPNDVRRILPESELYARCSRSIQDPTEHLALQLNETAFWHEGRAEIVKHILHQKCESKGLSALTSSSLDLVPHQASVVRKVLRDPFQRYLLADEVGLGKTIEAGALVKQYCLDEPDESRVLIVVPPALQNQWEQELSFRFHLEHLFGKSIFVATTEDKELIQKLGDSSGMIVVDEAHHLASWAWSEDIAKRQLFDAVRLATSAIEKKVLLLSATPVLHNEKTFLAMLNILDPHVYSLEDLEAFRTRVEKRQEVAESMLSLVETESNFFLEQSLDDLGSFLNDDSEFQRLKTELMSLIENDVDEEDSQRNQLIKAVRSHVSDTWRLHRRILRSRRTDATSCYLPGRGGAIESNYECELENGLEEALDEWRLLVSTECHDWEEPDLDRVAALCRTFYETGNSNPEDLEDIAQKRATGFDNAVELFESEPELLVQVSRAAKRCKQLKRMEKLCEEIEARPEQTSFIVFASAPSTADRIFNYATRNLVNRKVLRHSASDLNWAEFKDEQNHGFILVCDRMAEEGLNLQKRGAVAIHFDLPLSPNRIEQRMGRLDRFGSGTPVTSVVLVGETSVFQKNWFDLVGESLDVFRNSAASLQYVIEREVGNLWRKFLHSGSEAIEETSARLGGDDGSVAAEKRKIRAQDEIDSFDEDSQSIEVFEEMLRSDLEIGRLSQAVFDRWLVSRLHFKKLSESGRRDPVFTYCFTRKNDFGRGPGRKAKDTLLPLNEFSMRFAGSIDEAPVGEPVVQQTVPFAFDRVVSQKREARLMRYGDPFINSLEELTRWDDRGICFAFWRHQPRYRSQERADAYFRFDFILEADERFFRDLVNQFPNANLKALSRRTTELFPPKFVTLWLDSGLEQIANENTKNCLRVPFNKSGSEFGKDYNLNPRRWSQASDIYDLSNWSNLCFAARRKAEEIFRNHAGIKRLTSTIAEQAEMESVRLLQQFKSRIAIAQPSDQESLESERRFEQAFLETQKKTILHPRFTVDSVGAVFLSGDMPFADPPPEEDY